ncbi:hypothetical protein Pan258_35130 [Symmachiella dynata]|nr:hypothetical protein Pan258_35130 [Symmachiella dynata]
MESIRISDAIFAAIYVCDDVINQLGSWLDEDGVVAVIARIGDRIYNAHCEIEKAGVKPAEMTNAQIPFKKIISMSREGTEKGLLDEVAVYREQLRGLEGLLRDRDSKQELAAAQERERIAADASTGDGKSEDTNDSGQQPPSGADGRADGSHKSKKRWPQNPAVPVLWKKLIANNDPNTSDRDIALEFTDNDKTKAESLLRKCRGFKDELTEAIGEKQ